MEADATMESGGSAVRVCRECRAAISAGAGLAAGVAGCPACGGQLVAARELDWPGMGPRTVDRRGILLPRRHAVGGVITPR